MHSESDKLLKKHDKLIHSDHMKVVSHVQREADEWFMNTIMLEGIEVPFKYKRKKQYKSLVGQRINVTYYMDSFTVAGIDMECMTVVRLKIT